MPDERRGATSASNAHADDLCPGRHIAQLGLADAPSDDADFGRAIHDALAVSTGDEQILHKLDPQQRSIFDSCREIEKKKMAEFFGDGPVENNGPNRTKTWREQRFWVKVKQLSASSAPPEVYYEHSAKPDFVMRRGPRLLIEEYKTLPGDIPDSPSNPQLRDQAVVTAGNLIATEVGVFINQPLVTHSPVITVYDAAALKRAEMNMFDRVRRSNDPKSPRIAGETQCKFCKAKRICPEHARWRASLLPATVPLSPYAVQNEKWTLEQRSNVAEYLPVLRKMLDDAEDFLKECLAKDPESVPGFHLKPGAHKESITDPQELFTRFQSKGGTLAQFMECIAIVKGRLEGKVRDVTKTKGKALLAEMTGLLDGITDSKQNAPSLAKKKD